MNCQQTQLIAPAETFQKISRILRKNNAITNFYLIGNEQLKKIYKFFFLKNLKKITKIAKLNLKL